MRKRLRRGIGLLCLALAAALLSGTILTAQEMGRCEGLYLFLPEYGSISEERLRHAREETETGEFVLWGEQKNQMLENKEYSRRTAALVIPVYGAVHLLAPDAGMLEYLPDDSCLLEEETALELFGSSQVAGKQINYGDRSYTVSGIVHLGTPCMLYRSLTPENLSYGACRRFSGEKTEETRQRLVSGTGLSGKELSLCIYWLKKRTGLLMPVLLPSLILAGRGLTAYKRKAAKKKTGQERPGRREDFRLPPSFYLFCALVLLLFLGWWYGFSLARLPADFTTLAGWKAWAEEKRALYAFFQSRERNILELYASACAEKVMRKGLALAVSIATFLYLSFLV